MKQVKWVVENFTDSKDYKDLIDAIKKSNRYCFVMDKHNHFEFDASGFVENDCVIIQGSIQMTKNIRDILPIGCFPVSYSSYDKYLCSTYYPHFKPFLFNNIHSFTTIKNLKENKFDFYEKFGKDALIFVRPDSGEKPFQAQLIDLQDFDKFWEIGTHCSSHETDLVIVSTPKNIQGEFRIVCSKYNGGEIIAYSTYQYQQKRTLIPSVPKKALDKCREILNVGWYTDSIFCVDIFQDSDGNCWLGELTAFSSAGLYETNKLNIVTRVNEIVESEYNVHL